MHLLINGFILNVKTGNKTGPNIHTNIGIVKVTGDLLYYLYCICHILWNICHSRSKQQITENPFGPHFTGWSKRLNKYLPKIHKLYFSYKTWGIKIKSNWKNHICYLYGRSTSLFVVIFFIIITKIQFIYYLFYLYFTSVKTIKL